MTYKFDKDKYVTRGVESVVHPVLQHLLWMCVMVQVAKGMKCDYLQVFDNFKREIIDGEDLLVFTHFQEVPKRKEIHKTPFHMEYADVIGKKLYIIDDISHSTMLLCNEY